MNLAYELKLGLRYTRAGRASRRNGFISFISMISMLGIALGVATLIIVLSVVNGFQKEVRDRMLSAIPHIEIYPAGGGVFQDIQKTAALAKQNPQVLAVAPFIAEQALLAAGETMRGVQLRGIDPTLEASITDVAKRLGQAELDRLAPDSFGVILGKELARILEVKVGDPVTLIAPSGQMTPAGVVPRMKQLTVQNIFDTGHFEYDATLALMNVDDVALIYRQEGATGLRLRLQDPMHARQVAFEIAPTLDGEFFINDWTLQNKSWFDAVQIEKRMLGIILVLIVAVAAFNLVTTLVMTVTDKRADIAILRTLGSSPRSIMGVFMVQGSIIGVVGTAIGLLLGLLVAFNVDTIVPAIESLFQTRFLPAEVYLISAMPSDPQMRDIIPIVLVSLGLAFLATLYPSWRASRVNPAEALRYE